MRVQECSSNPGQCLYVEYNDDYLDIVKSYKRAWFCVQPMGDTPTRSALSDCFATGLVRASFQGGLKFYDKKDDILRHTDFWRRKHGRHTRVLRPVGVLCSWLVREQYQGCLEASQGQNKFSEYMQHAPRDQLWRTAQN